MSNELTIALTPSQAQFMSLDCRHPLYVAGKGSGKSYTMGLRAVLDMQVSAKAVVGVYEPSHELLRDVAIPNVEMWLQRFGLEKEKDYTHNKQEHKITVHRAGWGKCVFKSMNDVSLLIGFETSAAHVDELDTMPTDKAREAWEAVLDRNRLQIKNADKSHYKKNSRGDMDFINRACAYTSPEGFRFCYQTWKRSPTDSYKCVHGSVRENPAQSEDYILDRCKGKSQAWIDANIDGQFRNLTSGSVYHCYNRETHRSFEEIQPNEPLFIGCDFNVDKTSATVYVKRDGGRQWHVVDEIHGVRDTPQLVRLIQSRYAGHEITMYPDCSGKARSGVNASINHILLLREGGFKVKAREKNLRVQDRVIAANQAFSNMRIFVNDFNCPEVARCLEQQAYDKNGEPDKDAGDDHQNDATTYLIAYELNLVRPIFKIDYSFAQRGA